MSCPWHLGPKSSTLSKPLELTRIFGHCHIGHRITLPPGNRLVETRPWTVVFGLNTTRGKPVFPTILRCRQSQALVFSQHIPMAPMARAITKFTRNLGKASPSLLRQLGRQISTTVTPCQQVNSSPTKPRLSLPLAQETAQAQNNRPSCSLSSGSGHDLIQSAYRNKRNFSTTSSVTMPVGESVISIVSTDR